MSTKIEETEEIIDVPATRENGSVVLSQDRIDANTIVANIDAQEVILERLIKYVKDKLKAKVDYYSVKEGALPSLGLSGAEKINNIFCLAPKPILEEKIKTPKEVSYEYVVELYNKNTGKFIGSGVGCCSSQEDKFKYYWDKKLEKKVEIGNHLNIANTIKKMAYKRGYVDATLKATMASFLFTQDLEELPDYYLGNKNKATGGTGGSKKSYKKQELNPETFKMLGGKYEGKTLVECPSWYIEGQIKWMEDGKSDPAKFGYDKAKYIGMFEKALVIKKERKEAKGGTDYVEEKFNVSPDDIPE